MNESQICIFGKRSQPELQYQEYNFLENTKLWSQRKDDWFPGGRRLEQTDF